MAKLYAVDFPLYATAYVRAVSPEHALEQVKEMLNNFCVDDVRRWDAIYGGSFEDIDDHDGVTISPAMTPDVKDLGDSEHTMLREVED